MATQKGLTQKQKKFCREYSVDIYGNIYSMPRKNSRGQQVGGIYLKSQIGKNGYKTVHLHLENGKKRLYIHRIVAEAFIHNPLHLPEVNHKDTVKTNNYYLNLEWCTRGENVNHAIKNNLCDFKTDARIKNNIKLNRSKRVLTELMCLQIDELKGNLSQAKISKIIGVSPQTIMRYIKGELYERT